MGKRRGSLNFSALTSSVLSLAYRSFGRMAEGFLVLFPKFRDRILGANLAIHPEAYFSLAFFASSISAVPSFIATFLTFPSMISFVFILIPPIIFAIFAITPFVLISMRASSIENELPFASAYISSMATGGISPTASLERLSKNPWLPAMANEARLILGYVKFFNMDPLSAIEKNIQHNPSRHFNDFFGGYVSVVRGGGDVVHFLEAKTKELFEERGAMMRALVDKIAYLVEIYLIFGIFATMGLFTFFVVEVIMPIGVVTLPMLYMYTFVAMPLLMLALIFLGHTMRPKTMITMMEPYKVFGTSLLFTIAFSFILFNVLGIDLVSIFFISLMTVSVPSAIANYSVKRKLRGIESSMASFLRDVVELRKTGLSPESCIIQLSRRKYGELTKEIEIISSQLSMGVPIRKVYMDFAERVKNWFALINMYLLVDALEVGGGTVSVIDPLATFSRMSCDIEDQMRRQTAAYSFLPYVGAPLLSFGSIGILKSMLGAVAAPGIPSVAIFLTEAVTLLSIAVMFQCWLLGILQGKVVEGSISNGFKHSALLVLIAFIILKLVGI